MLFQDFPFAYDLQELKRNPEASQSPPTLPCGSALSRWKAGRKLAAVRARLDTLSAGLEHELRDDLFEEMAAFVAGAKQMDLRSFPVNGLLELWEGQERKVLDVFGPRLLMPGLIAATALGELRTFLQETLWDEDAEALAQRISAGGLPNRTLIADAELYEVAQGSHSLETWLVNHGHRAAGELDLAEPRWRERPEAVREMADRLGTGEGPLQRQRRSAEEIDRRVAALRMRLTRAQRREFDERLNLVRRYVALREDSKDFLMLGYDLLRDLAREAGRRLDIGDDTFYLTRDEVFDSLRVGFAPYHLIEQRKSSYQAESRLALPRVIDVQAIDMLGETPAVKPREGQYKALPVSSGESTGPARIVHSPTQAGDLGHGYILVCPSTDPSWTPLFVQAAGLVLECGGTLSHGAVVAREMGLPAVVLPEATKLFHEGEEIHVDGRGGWAEPVRSDAARRCVAGILPAIRGREGVGKAGNANVPIGSLFYATQESGVPREPHALDISLDVLTGTLQTADDTFVPRNLMPPVAGRKDRKAARISRIFAVVWAIYLVAFFTLPAAVCASADAAGVGCRFMAHRTHSGQAGGRRHRRRGRGRADLAGPESWQRITGGCGRRNVARGAPRNRPSRFPKTRPSEWP